jgi:hypothetical protein
MKKGVFISAVFAVLFLAALPITSQAVEPAESQGVDTCYPYFVAAPTNDYMAAAESQAVDTTGPRFVAVPTNDYMATAESQTVDTTGTPWIVKKPDLVACK